LLASLTVHVEQVVEGLSLMLLGRSGAVIQELPAPAAGDYVFEKRIKG